MIGLVELQEISSWLAQGGKVDVTFKVATRSGKQKATRKVQSVDLELGRLSVKYHGWDGFVLKSSEISGVEYLGGSS